MLDYEAMGQRIREIRVRKGLRQEDVAELAKISHSFYGHIERGTRKASLETMVALANVLDTGVDTMLADSINRHFLNERNIESLIGAARVIVEWSDRKESYPDAMPEHMGFRYNRHDSHD